MAVPTVDLKESNSSGLKRQEVVEKILKIAREEQLKGNKTVSEDKLKHLETYCRALEKKEAKRTKEIALSAEDNQAHIKRDFNKLPQVPKPIYSPLFEKFKVSGAGSGNKLPRKRNIKPYNASAFSLKNIEESLVSALEVIANLLDNLHLFSKFPMFPQRLSVLLKHTNKLWVLILVFLIRKTASQLLNVIRKEKKVNVELEVMKKSQSSKALNQGQENNTVFKRYQKFLKDLKFDKMMLMIELVGNFMDLVFNLIELYGLPAPDWFMSFLNFASMFMTVYRMNKDDEYVDDDISEDII